MSEQWYFADRGQGFGPFSLEQLRLLLACGLLHPRDLIWRDGALESIPAAEIDKLPRMANKVEAEPTGHNKLLWTIAACGLLLAVGAFIYAGKFLLPSQGTSDSQVAKAGSNSEDTGNDRSPDQATDIPASSKSAPKEHKTEVTKPPASDPIEPKKMAPVSVPTPSTDPTHSEDHSTKRQDTKPIQLPIKQKGIDLLARIDLKRHVIRGDWKVTDDGALRVVNRDGGAGAALVIPYRPKGGYILHLTISREKYGGIVLPVVCSGKQFGAYLSGGWEGSQIPVTTAKRNVDFFPTTGRVDITCTVRPKGVTISNNDSAKMEWSDWDNVRGTGRPGDIPEGTLWIKVWETYTIYRMALEPIDH